MRSLPIADSERNGQSDACRSITCGVKWEEREDRVFWWEVVILRPIPHPLPDSVNSPRVGFLSDRSISPMKTYCVPCNPWKSDRGLHWVRNAPGGISCPKGLKTKRIKRQAFTQKLPESSYCSGCRAERDIYAHSDPCPVDVAHTSQTEWRNPPYAVTRNPA